MAAPLDTPPANRLRTWTHRIGVPNDSAPATRLAIAERTAIDVATFEDARDANRQITYGALFITTLADND